MIEYIYVWSHFCQFSMFHATNFLLIFKFYSFYLLFVFSPKDKYNYKLASLYKLDFSFDYFGTHFLVKLAEYEITIFYRRARVIQR